MKMPGTIPLFTLAVLAAFSHSARASRLQDEPAQAAMMFAADSAGDSASTVKPAPRPAPVQQYSTVTPATAFGVLVRPAAQGPSVQAKSLKDTAQAVKNAIQAALAWLRSNSRNLADWASKTAEWARRTLFPISVTIEGRFNEECVTVRGIFGLPIRADCHEYRDGNYRVDVSVPTW